VIAWPSEFLEGVKNTNQSLTGSIGWQAGKPHRLRYRLMLSSAYRAPNVDDLAKIRVKSGNVLVPNLNLKPERSNTGELTLSKSFTNVLPEPNSFIQLDVTGYYTFLNDAIIRSKYHLPSGDTILPVNGEDFRVEANINSDEAYIFGLSANFSFQLDQTWTIKSNINYQKGRSKDTEQIKHPLEHIPPLYGKTAVRFTKNKLQAEINLRYNGKKPISEYGGSADNAEYATPEGSLAWTTLNAFSSYRVSDQFTINIAMENIFDLHYRSFASGISAPGRNFIISLRASI
jgi:hemoglobin/transferrin/lactoferrin receptor protein